MRELLKKTRAYKLFKAEAEQNRFSHAYLLLLDDERNLRDALKCFAKVLFRCDEPQNERERVLSSRVDAETFSDCLFFPEADKKFVVEDAERVTEESVVRPVEGNKKVFVIGDFAQANAASQNKLLKLLEEPPKDVIFLLGATTVYPVLQTVLSRVATLEIPPFETSDVADALRRIYVDKGYKQDDIELCAAACGGSLGAAQTALEGGEYETLVNDAFSLCLGEQAKLPQNIRKVGETKNKKELLFLLRVIFRDALLLKTLNGKNVLLRGEQSRLQAVAEKFSSACLLFAQQEITNAEKEIFFNAYFAQCLEVLFAKIFKFNS